MLKRLVALVFTSVLALAVFNSAPATAHSGWTSRGIPLRHQVLLGAAVVDVEAFETQEGGPLGVRRSFYSSSQVDQAVDRVRSDQFAGRIPWVSFKPPYSWAQMASGHGDEWASDLAAQLGTTGSPVWIAIKPEPEQDGVVRDWVAMQQHLSPIFRSYDNIAFSIILTGWNQFYSGRAKYSMDALWPGSEYVDVLGFDPYNWYGTTNSAGTVRWGWTELRDYYDKINAWRSAAGVTVPFAVAETGWSDVAASVPQNFTAPNGKVVSTRGPGSQWLARAYDDMKAAGGIALVYFNVSPAVNGEPADWTWPIVAGPKVSSFSTLLRRSDRYTAVDPKPRSVAPLPTPSANGSSGDAVQARRPYKLRIHVKRVRRTVVARARLIEGTTLQIQRKTRQGWRVMGSAANAGLAVVKLMNVRRGDYRAVVRMSPKGRILAKSTRVALR